MFTNDDDWDFLPVIGHGKLDEEGNIVLIHPGTKKVFTRQQATKLGLLDKEGELPRFGQPTITKCKSIKPISWSKTLFEATCAMSHFRPTAFRRFLFESPDGGLPPKEWLVGKKPTEARTYIAPEPANRMRR